jgi:K+-sensing histidine kinase KdpD
MDNALKYSPANGSILISAHQDDQQFCLEIIDQGPGFSEKALSESYELFAADNLTQYSYGFGIGLATAKLISDYLGCRLEISNNDPGAIVRMLLPA